MPPEARSCRATTKRAPPLPRKRTDEDKLREDRKLLELAVEHGRRGTPEPTLEYGCVDAAKVDGVAHVTHVRRAQVGRRSVDAPFDAAADQEERGGFTVIGSAIAVLFDTPAKLAKRQRQNAPLVAVRGEILVERGDCIRELQ